jgi:hypothetical protein
MAQLQTHFSYSTFLSLVVAAAGIVVFEFNYDVIVLAMLVTILAGVLPNIDHGDGTLTNEFTALVAAISPLVLLHFKPDLVSIGISKLTLVILGTYAAARVLTLKLLTNFTVNRGVIHSLPMSILVFELLFLFFHDLGRLPRLYVATAGFASYCSHLFIDSYGNLDLLGRVLGKHDDSKRNALSVFGESGLSTVFIYVAVFGFGYLIAKQLNYNIDSLAALLKRN